MIIYRAFLWKNRDGLEMWPTQAVVSQFFDWLLPWGQRIANQPEAIHGSTFQVFCHTVCALSAMTWSETDRSEYLIHNQALAENILEAVKRDPGRRVLVVVQCQWHHSLEPIRRQMVDWIEILEYPELWGGQLLDHGKLPWRKVYNRWLSTGYAF